MKRIAVNPWFSAFETGGHMEVVPSKECLQLFGDKAPGFGFITPNERGHYEIPEGLPHAALLVLMDEMNRGARHAAGIFEVPFGALPNGATFDTTSKFAYQGTYEKRAGKAYTNIGDIEVVFRPDEVVVYLPSADMSIWG